MKIIIYYLVLLIFIALLSGMLASGNTDTMSMGKMVSISVLLAGYVVAMSLIGEGRAQDERDQMHRYLANRAALIAGTAILTLGILYQLFTHQLDYWLLGALIGINLTKIITLIYANYRK